VSVSANDGFDMACESFPSSFLPSSTSTPIHHLVDHMSGEGDCVPISDSSFSSPVLSVSVTPSSLFSYPSYRDSSSPSCTFDIPISDSLKGDDAVDSEEYDDDVLSMDCYSDKLNTEDSIRDDNSFPTEMYQGFFLLVLISNITYIVTVCKHGIDKINDNPDFDLSNLLPLNMEENNNNCDNSDDLVLLNSRLCQTDSVVINPKIKPKCIEFNFSNNFSLNFPKSTFDFYEFISEKKQEKSLVSYDISNKIKTKKTKKKMIITYDKFEDINISTNENGWSFHLTNNKSECNSLPMVCDACKRNVPIWLWFYCNYFIFFHFF
jgi:hypothetical protein